MILSESQFQQLLGLPKVNRGPCFGELDASDQVEDEDGW